MSGPRGLKEVVRIPPLSWIYLLSPLSPLKKEEAATGRKEGQQQELQE